MIIKNFRPKPQDTTIVVGEDNPKYLHISGEKYQESTHKRFHQINKDAQGLSKLAYLKMSPEQRTMRARKAATGRWKNHQKVNRVNICRKEDIKES